MGILKLQYRSNVSYHFSSRFSRDESRFLRDSSRFLRDESRFSREGSRFSRESLKRSVWNILLVRRSLKFHGMPASFEKYSISLLLFGITG